MQRLIRIGSNGLPVSQPLDLRGKNVLIEIPANITLLQQESPDAAVAWRNATRAAFIDAFAAGYIVEDFLRIDSESGCYLLVPGRENELD
jgi:predicted GNAT superfamily acetyltransferase